MSPTLVNFILGTLEVLTLTEGATVAIIIFPPFNIPKIGSKYSNVKRSYPRVLHKKNIFVIVPNLILFADQSTVMTKVLSLMITTV